MKKLNPSNLYGPVANIFTAGNTGSWRLEKPSVDYKKCIKCGICSSYCPADVITVDKNSTEDLTIDFNYCKGCGICANECPKGCITMVPEEGK